MINKLLKLISLLFITTTINAANNPCLPMQGCLGISNDNANTGTMNAPMIWPDDLLFQYIYNHQPTTSANFQIASGGEFLITDPAGNYLLDLTELHGIESDIGGLLNGVIGSLGVGANNTTDPNSTIFEADCYIVSGLGCGSIPFPFEPSSQIADIDLTHASPGLGAFDTDKKSFVYYDGSQWQNSLSAEHVLGAGNVTVTNNEDGTVTINGSGGSGPTTQVQGSFNSINITTSTPVTNADTPIAVTNISFTPINQVDTNVTTMTISGVNTPIIQNTAPGGGRWFSINYDLTMFFGSLPGQVYTFTVYKNTGTPIYFSRVSPSGSGAFYQKIAIAAPMVFLNTNDYVYLTVSSSSPSGPPFTAYYFSGRLIDTTISSLPSTDALNQGTSNLYLSQNGGTTYEYLNGTATANDIPVFYNSTGKLTDSGLAQSAIITSSTPAGGNLSGTYPNPTVLKVNGVTYNSSSVTDGQIQIGATSDNSMSSSTISGTANQVNVTNTAHSITLSLPQSIAVSSSPTFNVVTATLAGNAASSTTVSTSATASSSTYYPAILGAAGGGSQSLNFNTGYNYVPSTNTITLDNGSTGSLIIGHATTPTGTGGQLRLDDNPLYFRSGADTNHGLFYAGSTNTFNGIAVGGPALFGNNGGLLGTVSGATQNAVFGWNTTSIYTYKQYPLVFYADTLGTVHGQVGPVSSSINNIGLYDTTSGQTVVLGANNSNIGFYTNNQATTPASTPDAKVDTTGSFVTNDVGGTFAFKSGTNSCTGTYTLSSGAATVTSSCIRSTDIIFTMKTANSGSAGAGDILITPASGSFTMAGGNLDNSSGKWVAFHVN